MLTSDCIIFQGAKDKDGYGWQRKVGERKAHRVAYVLANGPIPNGLWVLHKCDNPSCVNPDHLYLGDGFQNMKDRKDRGRNTGWKMPSRYGEANSNCKLSNEQVLEIRQRYKRGLTKALATQYGVCDQTILRIARKEKRNFDKIV